MSFKIYEWKELLRIRNFYGADLLLGNGFSLRLSKLFKYLSLFDQFLSLCGRKEAESFLSFKTANFELIQQQLVNTIKVNKIFGYPIDDIVKAVDRLKDGLIITIEKNHPPAKDIDFERLTRISIILDSFGDVFTLNYDLFLYHVIMLSKDRYNQDPKIRPYQDYYWGNYDDKFLEFMDYQTYSYYKHVYYLHGALFLFPGYYFEYYNDLKLRKTENELIKEISGLVKSDIFPLFVAGGTADDKLQTIESSRYLYFALKQFKEAKDSIVIYGASLSEPDSHIVQALNSKDRNIAISIYVDDKSGPKLREEMSIFADKLSRHRLFFFDSRTLFDV